MPLPQLELSLVTHPGEGLSSNNISLDNSESVLDLDMIVEYPLM